MFKGTNVWMGGIYRKCSISNFHSRKILKPTMVYVAEETGLKAFLLTLNQGKTLLLNMNQVI